MGLIGSLWTSPGFDAITELFECNEMNNSPIGLADIAEADTWFALIYNGWTEALCQHMAGAGPLDPAAAGVSA